MKVVFVVCGFFKNICQRISEKAKKHIDSVKEPKTPYADLIYDTLLPLENCIQSLLDIAQSGEFKLSTLFFTQLSNTKLDMVFREWPLGGRGVRYTKAIAEFFSIEDGRTVIRVVFQDKVHPFQEHMGTTEHIDKLFQMAIGAYRRK